MYGVYRSAERRQSVRAVPPPYARIALHQFYEDTLPKPVIILPTAHAAPCPMTVLNMQMPRRALKPGPTTPYVDALKVRVTLTEVGDGLR